MNYDTLLSHSVEREAQIQILKRMLDNDEYVNEKTLRMIFNIPKPKEEGEKYA